MSDNLTPKQVATPVVRPLSPGSRANTLGRDTAEPNTIFRMPEVYKICVILQGKFGVRTRANGNRRPFSVECRDNSFNKAIHGFNEAI